MTIEPIALTELPYPRFTDRARLAIMRAYRLANERRCKTVDGLLVVVAAIESDTRLRVALPTVTFRTDELLDTLQEVAIDDHGESSKTIIIGAVRLAETSDSPVDTLHLIQHVMANPSATVLAMLSELGVAASDVLRIVDQLQADR